MTTTTKQQKITPDQLKIIHVLLNKNGLIEHKAEIIHEYSQGRCTSSRSLSFNEAKALIAHLNTYSPPTPKGGVRQHKSKLKILSMAHELGWELPGGKIDMVRLNEWCIKYGHQHCPLDKYQDDDLPMLVTQFEKMYSQYINKL
jgi:hypothetical protein